MAGEDQVPVCASEELPALLSPQLSSDQTADREWQTAIFCKMTQCWVRRKESELTLSSLESKVTVARRISGHTKLGCPLGVTAVCVSLTTVLHTLPSCAGLTRCPEEEVCVAVVRLF